MGTLLNRRRYMGGGSPQPIDYGYFRIIPTANSTVTLVIGAAAPAMQIDYSVDDGVTWNSYTKSSSALNISVNATAGVPILWRGNGTKMASGSSNGQYSYFSCGQPFDIEGDLNSLIFGNNYIENQNYAAFSFPMLFRRSKVRYAHNCIIHCDVAGLKSFDSMFSNSTLETPPVIKINTIGSASCVYMFSGCASLLYCPQMNITKLQSRCFANMFATCTSITEGMDLPALTLVDSCYSGMYQNCSNLAKIKMLATSINANRCLYNWVSGVAAEGTFIKNAKATWTTTGANGVPTGWTIQYQ